MKPCDAARLTNRISHLLRRVVRCVLIPSAMLLLPGTFGLSSLPAEELSPSSQRMLDDVKLLASDELEGRGVGTAGLRQAAEYIAEQFRLAGLNVTTAGGDPYQEFEITNKTELGEPNTLSLISPDGKVLDLKYDEDFRTCSFGGSGAFSGPLVFAGYGIDSQEAGYDDFAGLDLNGKVVILLRRNPQQGNPHAPFAVAHGVSRHAALTSKLSEAFTRGAAAVLFVNDPYTGRSERAALHEQVENATQAVVDLSGKAAEEEPLLSETRAALRDALTHLQQVRALEAAHQSDPLMPFGYGGSRSGKSLPCFQISQNVCDRLLRASLKLSLEEIEAKIDETGEPFSRALDGWKAAGESQLVMSRVPVENVIGVLEGKGPFSQETIVVGAHFDHLGWGGEGSLSRGAKEIHNGADDNASGTSGLLELARRLGTRKDRLPRRVVFIAFTGEERGLLGSEEYVKNPLFPLDDTIAMFNMDMIGRMEGDALTVFGTGTSSRWDLLVDTLARESGFKVTKKPEGLGPSDHSSFYAQRIPVLFLFTGSHGDYHRPSDDWDKLNYRDMSRVVDLLEKIVIATAEEPTRPPYVHVTGQAMMERGGNRPYFGSIPDFGSDAPGYALQGVTPGSPAEQGGLLAKDVILRLGDHRIGGLDDFDLALRKFAPGQQVEVGILRDGKEMTVKVTLGTPRG